MNSGKCTAIVEVWSRVCGFFRPVQQWNRGKREEFRERLEYVIPSEKGEAPGPPEGVATKGLLKKQEESS